MIATVERLPGEDPAGWLVDATTLEPTVALPPGTRAKAISPDGSMVILDGIDPQYAGTDPPGTLVDLRSGTEIFEFPCGPLLTAAFSPDGQLAAAGDQCGNPSLTVVDTQTGSVAATFAVVDAGYQLALSFSPTGERLAVTTEDGVLQIFAVAALIGGSSASNAMLLDIRTHNGAVGEHTWHPDGSLIATAGFDGNVRLWDTTTGERVAEFQTGRADGGPWIDFSPDGTRLIAGGSGGITYTFVLDLAQLVDLAQSRLTRALTEQECRTYLHMDSCPPPDG